MTSATWMEMWLLIRNGDSENFEEMIRGMGKELLPWEKQFLTRIEQFEKTLLIRGLVKNRRVFERSRWYRNRGAVRILNFVVYLI